jgi:carboxyl-terminal processing protease
VADIRRTPSIETLILDLRDNGGGDNSNLRILGDLLPQGKPLVSFEAVVGDSGWREQVRNAFIPRGRLISYPAAVLVNRNTASLAEIFAAALQDIRQLTVVGERTRGKGTTQTWLTVGERYAIHLTVGRWRSPAGRSVDGVGIEPDIIEAGGSDALLSAAVKAVDRRRYR